MGAKSATLPSGFEDLEPWAGRWSLATERERNRARVTAELPELEALYTALLPRMEAIMEHLTKVDSTDAKEPDARLKYLAASFMEASLSVELFKSPRVPDALESERFEILR